MCTAREYGRGARVLAVSVVLGALVCAQSAGEMFEFQPEGLATDDGVGASVALDGQFAALGAPGDDQLGLDVGAVYIYDVRTGLPITILTASDGASGDGFGSALSLSGTTLAVGAPGRDDNIPDVGAVYLFDLSSGMETDKIVLDSLQLSGRSVSISDDYLAIGSVQSATVFDRSDLVVPVIELALFPGEFGIEVAVAGDRLAVRGGLAGDSGFLYAIPFAPLLTVQDVRSIALTDAAAIWVQSKGALVSAASNGAALYELESSGSEEWGVSCAARGDRLAICDPDAAPTGGVEVYDLADGALLYEAKSGAALSSDDFARSVDVRTDRLLVGAPRSDAPPSTDVGAAYLFPEGAAPTFYCTAKVNSLGCPPVISTTGLSTFSLEIPHRIQVSLLPANEPGLFFFGLDGANGQPFLGGYLCVAPPIQRTAMMSSGGVFMCNGTLAVDFNQIVQLDPYGLGLAPGMQINGQFYYRDNNAPDGTGVGLSAGIEFLIGN